MSFPQSNNASNANPNPYYHPGYGASSYPVARPVHNPYLPPPPVRSFYPHALPEGFEWQRTREVQWIQPVIRHEPGFGPIGDGRSWGPISIPVLGMPELREVDIFVMVRKFQSPVPTSQPPSVSTQPATISSTSTSIPTDKTEGNKSEKSGDLNLGKDPVGRSIDTVPTPLVGDPSVSKVISLSKLLEVDQELSGYFQDSTTSSSQESSQDQVEEDMSDAVYIEATHFLGEEPHAILDQFVSKVDAGMAVRPSRYDGKVERFRRLPHSYDAWEDAMLHDMPVSLLKSLKKIPYIFRVYTGSQSQGDMPTFLFPCSLSKLPERFRSKKLEKQKDNMCLELTLHGSSKNAYHLFLKPLKTKEYGIETKYGTADGEVTSGLKDSNYPSLGSKPNYGVFRSTEYGVEIKALMDA